MAGDDSIDAADRMLAAMEAEYRACVALGGVNAPEKPAEAEPAESPGALGYQNMLQDSGDEGEDGTSCAPDGYASLQVDSASDSEQEPAEDTQTEPVSPCGEDGAAPAFAEKPLPDESVDAIRAAMNGFTLAQPEWAREMDESKWIQGLVSSAQKKAAPVAKPTPER